MSRLRRLGATLTASLLAATLSITLVPGQALADPTLQPFVPPPPPAPTDSVLAQEVIALQAMATRLMPVITAGSGSTLPGPLNGNGRRVSDLALVLAYASVMPSVVGGTSVNGAWQAQAVTAIDKFTTALLAGDDARLACDPYPYTAAGGNASIGVPPHADCAVPDWTLTTAQIAEAAWAIWPALTPLIQDKVLRTVRLVAHWTTGLDRTPCPNGVCKAAAPQERGLGDLAWYRDLQQAVMPNRGNNVVNNGEQENSAAEELAWHERLLNVAVRMLPGTAYAANVDHYERFQAAMGAHAFATTADYSKQVLYNGVPFCKWLKGSNNETSGIVRNHDVRSPVYTRTPHQYASWALNGAVRTQHSPMTLYGVERAYNALGGSADGTPYRQNGDVYYPDGDSDNGGRLTRPAGPAEFTNTLTAALVLPSGGTAAVRAKAIVTAQRTKVEQQQALDGSFGTNEQGQVALGDYGANLDAMVKFVQTYFVLGVNQFAKPSGHQRNLGGIPYAGTAC
jgi:hypothetical protein